MEFSLRRVSALFRKEIRDIGKNMNVLLMCVLPILFSVIYTKMFVGNGLDIDFGRLEVLTLCVGMNLALVSSFVIAMLIAEEKEKNTLRTLLLSGMSPLEFLTGKAFIAILLSEIINVAMFFIIGMNTASLGIFILLTFLVVISMVEIGAMIGMIAPNQMSTGVVGMPVIMILLLVPLFARLDETIEKIARFLPNYNLNLLMEKIFTGEGLAGSAYSIAVILAWIVIAAVGFVYTYNKVGLDK